MNWYICGEYRIEDGLLLPSGNVVSSYDLVQAVNAHDVLAEFAKLRRGAEDALLRFAGRWGMLAAHDVVKVGLPDQEGNIVERLRTDGEEADWIWGHAQNVGTVLNLSRLLQEEDLRGLEAYLGQVFGPVDLDGGSSAAALKVYDVTGRWARVVPRWRGEPFEVAQQCVAEFLNPNLDEPQFEVLIGPLRVQRVARSLVQEIYWRLASLVTGARRIGRCEECGALFEANDERQRFCPAPRDSQDYAKSKGKRAESNCAYAHRKRRSRQAARAKEEES